MDSQWYLGVVYGMNCIHMGLAQRGGKVKDAVSVEISGRTQQNTASKLLDAIEAYTKGKDAPTAVGIGLPGYVNPQKGLWMHCMLMGIRQPIAITSILTQALSIPVYIDNDLNAATLAENYFGIGQISKEFLFVQADEGVALGIVTGGRLLRGIANCAGEIGHLTVEPDGELCECNSRGCLEPIVSINRIAEDAEKHIVDYPDSVLQGESMLTPEKIFTAAQSGDELALRIAYRAVKALGIGLVGCVNLLNPEHIVLTGRVGKNNWFLEQVKKYVYANGFVSSVATLKDISSSALTDDFPEVLGAASLCYVTEYA